MQYGVILAGKPHYPDKAPIEQPADTCAICRQFLPASTGITTGYALTDKGERICYSCAARIEEDAMEQMGRATLYLTGKNGCVTNWTGVLCFPVLRRHTSRHNMGGTRIDVWFRDSQGRMWHGVHIGQSHDLVRCRRLRS